uniref:Uncharacterized protein n=1 Tax=Romanomermis culicivorax TaxID=13658 RepID=A0A915JQX8_ROMCU
MNKFWLVRGSHSSSLLPNDISSSPGKLMTRPPHGWTSQKTPIFGDCRTVAIGKGDASMMLTLLLMACSISPKWFATTVHKLVTAAAGCCWAIADSIWAFAIVGGNAATMGAGWAIRLACLMTRWMASTAGDDGLPSNRSLSMGIAPIVPLEMNS